MYSIISFFTGAGFLDLGFEKEGFSVDLVNEFDPSFLRGYRYSRGMLGSKEPRYGHHLGSVEEFLDGRMASKLGIIVDEVRRSGRKVGFIGGPPCPDFSIAGKQAGVDGDNGRLSAVYSQLINEMKPDFFVFENVKGLWSTKVHREFYDQMKESFVKESGYFLHDRLVNSLSYGVPQDRERIFLFGSLEDGGEFPWEAGMTYFNDMTMLDWPGERTFVPDIIESAPPAGSFPVELTVEYWFQKNDVERHANSGMFFTPKSERIKTVPEGQTGANSLKRLHRWRYSPTAAYGNNEVHLHPYRARRMSVAEALSLQSLPKEFQLPKDMPLSKCFKTIGNGVPYLAARGLAKSIKLFMDGAKGVNRIAPLQE